MSDSFRRPEDYEALAEQCRALAGENARLRARLRRATSESYRMIYSRPSDRAMWAAFCLFVGSTVLYVLALIFMVQQ